MPESASKTSTLPDLVGRTTLGIFFSVSIFGIKTASSSLIIFQKVTLLTSLLGQLKDILKEKRHTAGRSPTVSWSYTTMSRLTGHLQPRRNCPTFISSVLITHPILRIWPRRITTCSLDWKNNWKVAIFRPRRRWLLSQRAGWTDTILNFFWVDSKI